MTGRTHDLAAFTALNYIAATTPLPPLTLATIFVAFSANLIGGLTPDIDQPTGNLWHKIPAGTIYSRLITPLLGGHRYISHSILGIAVFGFLVKYFLNAISTILIVDMNVVWFCFMTGYISHLFMDMFTKEGVPLLFPISFKIGIPPFAFMRIKTGGIIEKFFVFPTLLIINGYIVYLYHSHFLDLLRNYIK